MSFDPWYKASFNLEVLGVQLKLDVPHDVFSTLRIDEGTLLLLNHLPLKPPKTVLDMGCGYGALGLPIAARYPDAQFDLVDRDLLAVKWASKNAEKNQLSNVTCFGSLGFRDLPSQSTHSYDWILCNVPARIGKPFIQNILEEGRARLSPEGELRVVVILDLIPMLKEISTERGFQVHEIAIGPRHGIFSVYPEINHAPIETIDHLYIRDTVSVDSITLLRPFDLGGDDPKRLNSALPLLFDTLPRQNSPKKILCVRSAYGAVALTCRKRYPDSEITAFDRDLLGLDFTRQNDLRLNEGATLLYREKASIMDALLPDDRFDLITIELSPSAGEAVAEAELRALHQHLSPGGRCLILALDKVAKDWVKPLGTRINLPLSSIASRAGFTVFQLDSFNP